MITVAGYSPSLDITYVVDELRLGAIHRPTACTAVAGGKAVNMAKVAAALGAEVRVVAVLGGPTGENVRAGLAARGADVAVVASPVETRTCVAIASTASGELTEVYQWAPAIPGDVWTAFVAVVGAALGTRGGWLSMSGSAPRELPESAVGDLVRLGQRHAVAVAVDVHGPALPEATAARPALVKINRYEAAELLDRPPATDLLAMAAEIRGRTGGTVVLTDGVAGSVALDGQHALRAEVPGLRGRFSTGSGDAFLGGMVTALDRSDGLPDALRLGMAAGVANAMVPGPGELSTATVAAVASRVRMTAA